MKKSELRSVIHDLTVRNDNLRRQLSQARAENQAMKETWAPIPIAHPFTPRDSQCKFCDDPQSHPRHGG